MAGPPTDIPASALFAKLLERPRPTVLVDLPRYDEEGKPIGQVAIRILTQEETFACSSAAEAFARKMLKEERGGSAIPGKEEAQRGYSDLYNNAAAVEILSRACRDPENPAKPFFPGARALQQALTNDEIGVLMNHYLITQERLGPIISEMDKEEMEAWIRRLVEGGSVYPFALLSLGAQAQLVMHLASSLYPSLTASGSSGELVETS